MSGSPFAWRGTPLQADWTGIVRSATNSTSSTATVARKRKAGEDPGAIEGLSGNGDKLISVYAQKRHGGAHSKAVPSKPRAGRNPAATKET